VLVVIAVRNTDTVVRPANIAALVARADLARPATAVCAVLPTPAVGVSAALNMDTAELRLLIAVLVAKQVALATTLRPLPLRLLRRPRATLGLTVP